MLMEVCHRLVKRSLKQIRNEKLEFKKGANMNNKHILQIVSGLLMVFSFFSTWVYDGAFTTITPSELIAIANRFYLPILIYLLPILGLLNGYRGFMKRYSVLINIICIADCVFLMMMVSSTVPDDWILKSGFYMAGLAALVSAASIFIMKKEVKSQNIHPNA